MILSPTIALGSNGDDSKDTDGDEADVEFWGGESSRAQNELQRGNELQRNNEWGNWPGT